MAISRNRFIKSKLALQGSVVLVLAMLGVNALNYGYTLVLGRFLGPEQYGAYASFISLFLLLSLLPLTLQQVAAKYAATQEAVTPYVLRAALVSGLVLGLIMVFAASPLSKGLHLPASWFVIFGILMPLYAVIGVLRGEAQGQQAFGRLGSNMLLEHLLKIVFTPLAFLVFAGAHAAVIATLAALPFLLFNLWRYWRRHEVVQAMRREVRRYAMPVFVNLAASAILINSDVLMVNALLPTEAGLYAANAILGRAVFYSAWVIGLAVFPMVAARHKAGQPHMPLLIWTLLLVAAICLSITLFCVFYPDFVMRLLFGEAFIAGSYLLAPYVLMTTFYALAATVSNHYLALGRHLAGYLPLAFALLQVVVIAIFHDSSFNVILQQLWIKALLFISLIFLLSKGD